MRIKTTFFALVCASPIWANEPLSVIDWLSESVEPVAQPAPTPTEDAVSDGAATPDVTVSALDAPSPDGIGILPTNLTGLPSNLWSGSDAQTVATLVAAPSVNTLPAIHGLLSTLLLAEADPPAAAGPDAVFFLARVDKLLDIGALEPASELLARTEPSNPALLRRAFDVGLLTGNETEICELMRERPSLAPTYPARIFCLARNGDWPAAALTLNTAKALDKITNEQDQLLARFLDPELSETMPALTTPSRVTPLEYRMREAIGEPLSTRNLPRAFAHADLRSIAGWKPQLEAAERLSRTNAISENRLLGVYTDRTPAASGGVWDRAEAVQRLETALSTRDPAAISEHLPAVWEAAAEAQLEVAFARLFGEKLQGLPLTDTAQNIAAVMGLLSDTYEITAKALPENSLPFATAIAQGITPPNATSAREIAVKNGFEGVDIARLKQFSDNGMLGEAILRAMALFNEGLRGDGSDVATALSFFRHIGLEDIARRAALQYLLIQRDV